MILRTSLNCACEILMIFYHDAGKSDVVTKHIIYWQHQKRSDRSAKGQNCGILANAKGTLGIIFPSEKEKKKKTHNF